MESLVVAFLVASIARLAGLALNNLAAANAMFVPALYLLPLGVMALALAVIKGGDRQKSGLAAVDKLVEYVSVTARPILARFKRRRAGVQPT
jgi:uncharacterized membrane protein YhaH (DUF805 family)